MPTGRLSIAFYMLTFTKGELQLSLNLIFTIMRILIITTVALLCFSAGCKKKNKCARAYILEHPMSVYPVQESYNIGDTIRIEMNFPDIFTLLYTRPTNTDEYLTTSAQLKNFDFKTTIMRIFKIENPDIPAFSQVYSWFNFQSGLIIGQQVYEDNKGLIYSLNYEDETYTLKLYIVCQNSGTYILSPLFMSNDIPSNNTSSQQVITGECEKERIYMINFPINRQSDGSYLTNYHIFEQHTNPALETDLDRIKNRCFTFKVN